jgi:hypothetical protein
MDGMVFTLAVLLVFVLWALLAPAPKPDTRPTTDELVERQRQIDRANHVELL